MQNKSRKCENGKALANKRKKKDEGMAKNTRKKRENNDVLDATNPPVILFQSVPEWPTGKPTA